MATRKSFTAKSAPQNGLGWLAKAKPPGPPGKRRIKNQNKGGFTVQTRVLFSILRAVGYAVVLLMVVSIIYASATGIRYWAGIGV